MKHITSFRSCCEASSVLDDLREWRCTPRCRGVRWVAATENGRFTFFARPMQARRPSLPPRRWLACATLALACTLASAQTAPVRQPADLRAARDPAMQQALEGAVRDLGLQPSLAQHRLSVALVDVTDSKA